MGRSGFRVWLECACVAWESGKCGCVWVSDICMSTSIKEWHLNTGRPLFNVFFSFVSTFFLFFFRFIMERDVEMLEKMICASTHFAGQNTQQT